MHFCLSFFQDQHLVVNHWCEVCKQTYRNDPKFSDEQVLANSADHSVCIFWMHDSIVEPHCSNFRISTAIFPVSECLGVLRYIRNVSHACKYVERTKRQDVYQIKERRDKTISLLT